MYSDMENEQTIFKQHSKAKNIMQFHSLEFLFFLEGKYFHIFNEH